MKKTGLVELVLTLVLPIPILFILSRNAVNTNQFILIVSAVLLFVLWTIPYATLVDPWLRRVVGALFGTTIKWRGTSKSTNGAETQTLSGHTGEITSVAFSPDGQTLASGSFDKSVKLWDAKTGTARQTLSGHSDTVTSVAISSDDRTIASGSRDDTIRLWDPQTGALKQTIKTDDIVLAVAFAPQGEMLSSISGDKTVKLLDAQSGMLKKTLTGEDNLISVAFSPDGKLLASGSYDKTVRVWDVQTAELKLTLTGHSDVVESVGFSPGRHHIGERKRGQNCEIVGMSIERWRQS